SDSNLEDDSMHTDVLEHNGGKHPLSAPARTPEEGDESSLKRFNRNFGVVDSPSKSKQPKSIFDSTACSA
ncbi:hypothetical protein RRG08_004708, partial [Elysia crispata]